MQFKYFKLLIQEFAVKIDQGLIVSILAFLRPEKVGLFLKSNLFGLHRLLFEIEFISTNDKYG